MAEKGDKVGKPLGYDFLREKKISGKRIYFLVYEEVVIILLIGVSSKKNQEEVIIKIKSLLTEYKNLVKEEFT